jgi:hypothetical protein
VSFGTHFFQDLVETGIYYLPLYPDDKSVIFNEEFLKTSPNMLSKYVSWAEKYERVVRLVDVSEITGGKIIRLIMDGDAGKALAYLYNPDEVPGEEEWEAPPCKK